MNKYTLLPISLLAAVLAGCASNDIPDPEPGVDNDDATSVSAYDADGAGRNEPIADDSSAELATVVYFDYDQSDLRPEYVDLLARHADRLSNGGRVSVRLEGHADERGSREYNVGLGERRSQAVRRLLVANGVSANQLATVSFGEERPAVTGSNEESYALNRRVEIRYAN
jgi:peptidoglycan-associated lipoprotein